jgi:hypothetical protein
MGKSTFFSGQPIFSQLIKLLPKGKIAFVVQKFQADRYYKKFTTWTHLITMLYSCYQSCTTLREVTTGIRACGGRLNHLSINVFPAKSTLSDANQRRSNLVFEEIFYQVYDYLRRFLPDSRMVKGDILNKLFIIDSTTITLFRDILKAAGRPPKNGKKKGGVKVHMMINAAEDVPSLVRITSSATNDTKFFKFLNRLKAGSFAVFDKGYTGFYQLIKLTNNEISWVTRQRSNSIVTVISETKITKKEKDNGICKDEQVILGHKKKEEKIQCRRIVFYDKENNRTLVFITNNNDLAALQIADIYKQRWQIEILFRRLKQNMQLDYFLGDNENAIKLQIWCTLIADLLLKVATSGIRRRWSFSNLAAIVRLHLMNYTNLKNFLNKPDRTPIYNPLPEQEYQLKLRFSDS